MPHAAHKIPRTPCRGTSPPPAPGVAGSAAAVARRASQARSDDHAVTSVLSVLQEIIDNLEVYDEPPAVSSDDQIALDVLNLLGMLRGHFNGDSPIYLERT